MSCTVCVGFRALKYQLNHHPVIALSLSPHQLVFVSLAWLFPLIFIFLSSWLPDFPIWISHLMDPKLSYWSLPWPFTFRNEGWWQVYLYINSGQKYWNLSWFLFFLSFNLLENPVFIFKMGWLLTISPAFSGPSHLTSHQVLCNSLLIDGSASALSPQTILNRTARVILLN